MEKFSALELAPLLKRHRLFCFASSLALALLYAEEAWASFQFWSRRSLSEATALIAIIAGLAFVGYLVSFFLPPRRVNARWNYPRAWGVLSAVTAGSAGITVALNAMLFALLLYLVNFDWVATYHLLRDVYVYTVLALVFFHGLLLYVRYLHYLYGIPGFVQPVKVIAASVGMAVAMLLVGGFLFLLDLHRLDTAPLNEQGLLGLHVYARALYGLTLALGAYAWHLRWIADH